jgi:hypothetical protein
MVWWRLFCSLLESSQLVLCILIDENLVVLNFNVSRLECILNPVSSVTSRTAGFWRDSLMSRRQQLYNDQDSGFFVKEGVKVGTAWCFIRDIQCWVQQQTRGDEGSTVFET